MIILNSKQSNPNNPPTNSPNTYTDNIKAFNNLSFKMSQTTNDDYLINPKLAKIVEEFEYEKTNMYFFNRYSVEQINQLISCVKLEFLKIDEILKKLEIFFNKMKDYKHILLRKCKMVNTINKSSIVNELANKSIPLNQNPSQLNKTETISNNIHTFNSNG